MDNYSRRLFNKLWAETHVPLVLRADAGSSDSCTSLALPRAGAEGGSAEQALLLAMLSAHVLIHRFWQFAPEHSLPLPGLGTGLFLTLLMGY